MGPPKPVARSSKRSTTSGGQTENRRRVGLGRTTPWFNYGSPRTIYSGPIIINTLPKIAT